VIDEVNTYTVQASATQIKRDYTVTRPSCSAVLDHFDITHNGAVSDCSAPAQITISAHDTNHNPYPLTGVTLSLSTTPALGTWSQVAGGSISLLSNIVAGAGTASYTFSTNASNPNGETRVTFGLTDATSESLALHATLGTVTETSGAAASCVANDYTTPPTASCNVPRQFLCAVPFGFNCVESSVADSINGHLYTKVVGQPFSLDVVALKDAATVQTSYASGNNTSVTVELVNGAGSTACAARTAISPAVSQTLTFLKANQPTNLGRLSSAAMTVNNAYSDVRCRITDANQSPSVVGCSVDDFAIRPQGISLNTSASATAPGATATPTVAAGKNFTLQAVVSPASATNYAGTVTQTASILTAQDPTQSTQVGGGTLGTLAPATLVTGAAAVNATYSEVGYVYVNAGAYADTSYTAVDSGSGDCVATSSSNVLSAGKYGCNVANQSTQSLGRFIPDHLETAVQAVPAPAPIACPSGLTCPSNPLPGASGLVYSNQPLTVQLSAKNAAAVGNTVTKNYTGLFAKPTNLSTWDAKGSSTTQNPGSGTLGNASQAASTFTAGVGTSPVLSRPFYALGTTTTAPKDVFVRAIEGSGGDGVSSLQTTTANSVEAGLKVASGRIFIPNTYGAKQLPLSLPIAIQYYTGSNWVTSLTDSSSLSFNSALTAAGGNVTATQVAGPANCISINSPATASVIGGVRTLSLAASSAICSYAMSLNNAPSYLPIAPTAGGRATFGLFKSPLLYRRENY
jgi:MSHA biogenesis protein MshQ